MTPRSSYERQFEQQFKLFGGTCELVLYDIDAVFAELISQEFYDEAIRLQKIFNFYDANSELSQLNAKREMRVSQDLFTVIERAVAFAQLSSGAYDISWGKRILARKGKEEEPLIHCSYRDIVLIPHAKTITLTNPDILIDLGSIAKGYIVDKLTQFLVAQGVEDFLIDARGDIRAHGTGAKLLEVQDPRSPDNGVYPFLLQNNAVATSGDYHQYYGSYEKNHMIGKTDFISVTVIAPDCMTADAMASLIYLGGSKKFHEHIFGRSDICVVACDKNLNWYVHHWPINNRENTGLEKTNIDTCDVW